MKKICFLTFVLLSFFCTAHAQDVQKLTCPALSDSKAYEKNNLKAYETLSPGLNDYIFRTSTDYRTDFSLNEKTLSNFSVLNDKLKKKKIDLVLFFIPTRGMVNFNDISESDKKKFKLVSAESLWSSYSDRLNSMNKKGLIAIGINQEQSSKIHDFFYKRDHHWRPEATRIAAGLVAGKVKDLNSYPTIAKKSFISQKDEDKNYKGTFTKAYKTLCNTDTPPEKIITFKTTTKEGSDDLFQSDKAPEIVLIGTSNSVNSSSYSNFDGFLKEALGTDVLNLSKTGGGFSDSMAEYLNSDQFKKSPPKIIIWEIPSYYDLNKQNSFFAKILAKL